MDYLYIHLLNDACLYRPDLNIITSLFVQMSFLRKRGIEFPGCSCVL